jgi:hypothetical protein
MRDLIILNLILISAFLFFSYLYSKQIQNNITLAVIDSAKQLVIDKNERFFSPIINNLNVSRKWAELETLTPRDYEKINKRFIPILETLPQISSVIISNSDGVEYFFTRKDNNWLSRSINPAKDNKNLATWRLWSANNELLKQWEETTDYRSQDRPWYQMGLNADADDQINWTRPYIFYTRNEPGLTGVTRWKGTDGLDILLAFDVTLGDITTSLAQIKVSKNDLSFLVGKKEGEIILPPGNQHIVLGDSEKGLLYAPDKDVKNFIKYKAVNEWTRNGRQLDQPFRITDKGNNWWFQFFPLAEFKHELYAAVGVSEKDLTAVISENRAYLFIAILLLVLFSVSTAYLLVRKYSHQLKDLPITSIPRDNFQNEIYKLLRLGESEFLELKSTMRKNLKSGKNGKEIEIAWLKGIAGFLNTEGGILLIGIDDDGNILGIGPDEFENDDKIKLHFKNLINQHLGLEFSGYIQMSIKEIEQKSIIVVECERSNEPVFLFNRNDEEFYIRSGPASVKLSISQALKYIQNRF